MALVWLVAVHQHQQGPGLTDQINPLHFIYCKKLSLNEWWWPALNYTIFSPPSCDHWRLETGAISEETRPVAGSGQIRAFQGGTWDGERWGEINRDTETIFCGLTPPPPPPPLRHKHSKSACLQILIASLLAHWYWYRPISPLDHWKQPGARRPGSLLCHFRSSPS